jgi:hypothetical protein
MDAPMKDDDARLVSKVLLLERDPGSLDQLRNFCEGHDLVGLKVQPDNVMSVLKSNVDLGGIFLAEDFGQTKAAGRALAHTVHAIRPELPIFLRCETPAELSDSDLRVVRAVYSKADIEALVPIIEASIFSLVYPNKLVRGISEFTIEALQSQFKHVTVQGETPYIVRDRIIHGEMFTLIPLESAWCRGYMMLQAKEEEMRHVLGLRDATDTSRPGLDFRDLNNALGEVTNLIWGAFKNRYISYGDTGDQHLTQIPIVINHLHNYISFGSEDPQLCFRYTLTDLDNPDSPPTHIYQRFVFNLSWSPDDLKENQSCVEELFKSGELELF